MKVKIMDIRDKINTIVKYSSLYLDNSNATEERNTDSFHVELQEEEEIRVKICQGIKVVIMTGEAGEGKSHIIKRISKEEGYIIEEDFSALSLKKKKDLINEIDLIIEGISDKKYIIAANVGILIRTILKEKPALLNKIKTRGDMIFRLNFEDRNLACDRMKFIELIQSFLYYDNKECDNIECSKYKNCPFEKNIKDLQNEVVIDNIRVLCDAIFLRGGHVTLRELLSLIATMVTYGMDCKMMNNSKSDNEKYRYFNIFEVKEEGVLEKISQLDPSKESNNNDYILYTEAKDLSEFKYRKRQIYFETDKIALQYKRLPIPYLNEFREFLIKINNEPYFFDVTEASIEFEILKDGLAKLISPNQTNLQITFFDMPKSINKRIKTQFSIDFNELTLVWHHPDWKPELMENSIKLNSNINYFCLSGCYSDEDGNIKYFPLKIYFELYEQIRRARDNYFLPLAYGTLNKFGLSEFFLRILKTNPKYSEKLVIGFEPTDNLIDFEIGFYTKNKLLKKNTIKQVIIKKV
jgi:hypothetical protein